jgi:hypothetical protein
MNKFPGWLFAACALTAYACTPRSTTTSPNTSSASKVAASASASTAPSVAASASAPTPPVRATCAEPASLKQLQSHKGELHWDGDDLVDAHYFYDPETLQASPRTPKIVAPLLPMPIGSDTLEQRGAAIVRVDSAGNVLWKTPIGAKETVRSLEDARWLVIDTGTRERPRYEGAPLGGPYYRVVDATTGATPKGTYLAIQGHYLGDYGSNGLEARVIDLESGKVVAYTPACAAGGVWEYSLSNTGRFLVCEANRGRSRFWDAKRAGRDAPIGGFGVSLAPNDTYAIAVPAIGGFVSEASLTEVVRVDLNSDAQKALTSDVHVPKDFNDTTPNTPVAFCGQGALFAIVTLHEIAVYRGADGVRLAGTPAMPGGTLAFDRSGRYLLQSRAGASTVYRLDI